jgi:hypothetical protein
MLLNKSGNGIFKWSDASRKRIQVLKWNGDNNERKPIHMVGYLVELVYDLSIAPNNNISGSPGFELPLGSFQKRNIHLCKMPE